VGSTSPIVDSLLVIGVLTNLVKGGDLLLRKTQKEWLQERFEVLTLRLDDIRPVSWFAALSRPRPAAVWSAFSALFVFVAPISALGGALAFLLDLWIMSAQNILAVDAPPRLALGVGLLVAVPVSALVLWKLGPGLVRTLVGTGHGGRFFGRLFILYLTSAAAFGAFYGASVLAKDIASARHVMAVLWPLLLSAFVLNAAGLLLVTVLFFLWILRLLFSAANAVCWRIAEYDRGVFAALLLIVTAGLGLYRVLLTGG
jgi:hypothetical protein